MRVAVLGAGPAGLMAAHAVQLAGHTPHIFSRKVRSPIGGAKYLHQAIPGVTAEEPDGQVMYVKLGTPKHYARKVYGDANAHTSWQVFPEGNHMIWSLRDAYRKLCTMYWDQVRENEITAEDILFLRKDYDVVMSTIPASRLCVAPGKHEFSSQAVFLERRDEQLMDNTIIYNGRPTESWYRSSCIFGEGWVEYRAGLEPATAGVSVRMGREHVGRQTPKWVRGNKPLHTDCTCHPDVVRLGRFGRWKKGVLTSDAFEDAMGAMEAVNAVH
jgi:hypothetical protein